MILFVVAVAVTLAITLRFAVPAVRRRRMASELRGDWWTRFEKEFRAYSSRFMQSAREAEWRG